MLVQQLQKLFASISGDITAEGWIKPYDVPTALLFRVGCDQWLAFQVDVIIATLFQCMLILCLRFIENFFIGEIFQLFYYLWRVV